MLKALTVRQPYASAIICQIKQYETRTWQPKGNIEAFAVHAGLQCDRPAHLALQRNSWQQGLDWPADANMLPRGAVLGIVRLVDVTFASVLIDDINDLEKRLGFWDDQHLAWELEVVEVFDTPIPAKGQLGFWNWQPPASKQQVSDYLQQLRTRDFTGSEPFYD